MQRSHRWFNQTACLFILILAGWMVSCSSPKPAAPRKALPFDPSGVAAVEMQMWKAYYAMDAVGLQRELANLMRAQFKVSPEVANAVANDFTIAAGQFALAKGQAEAQVLPSLESGYQKVKVALNLPFDAKQAARAELAWWTARRDGSKNSVDQVGQLVAELYAILYGKPANTFKEAGVLRAQAARLRDAGGQQANWQEVENILKQSYTKLGNVL